MHNYQSDHEEWVNETVSEGKKALSSAHLLTQVLSDERLAFTFDLDSLHTTLGDLVAEAILALSEADRERRSVTFERDRLQREADEAYKLDEDYGLSLHDYRY
jgi:hypothetical protein